MLTIFSACEWPGLKSAPLREPPLVPGLPDAPNSAEAPAETHIGHFTDNEAIQNFAPNLPQAVAHALKLSVLRPATPQTPFEPERAITYGEFRQWANDYQNVLIDEKTQATATSAKDTPPPIAGPLAPPASIAAHLGNPTLLPAEMMWGTHGVREQTTLNRESLCALAVFLNGQDTAARNLNAEQIAATLPGQGTDNTAIEPPDGNEGALSQLADFYKISPWAQRYVALAYRNDWFEPVFSLSLAQITTAEGLHPAQAVNRGEALLLLDLLYGQRQPSSSSSELPVSGKAMGPGIPLRPSSTGSSTGFHSTSPLSQAPTKGQKPLPVSKSNLQNLPEQPLPLGHLQSMQESGPQGTRSALRVSGPE